MVLASLFFGAWAFGQTESKAFSFVAIGDMPYGKAETAYPPYEQLISTINGLEPDFTIHIGDIKSGSTDCSDQEFQNQLDFFNTFNTAVIYTPGDNEWTDCHRKKAGEYDPIERLGKLREMFFAEAMSLGKEPFELERQSDLMPEQALYVENSRFIKNGVMFLQIHVVGSNNNFEVRDEVAVAEFVARDKANIAWIQDSFAMASAQDIKAIVVSIHADVFDTAAYYSIFPRHSGFLESIGNTLIPWTEEFGKPVLLIHGDSHVFRIDRPFKNSEGNTLTNLVRLEVFGSSNVHAVKVLVEPNAVNSSIFAFQPVWGTSWTEDTSDEVEESTETEDTSAEVSNTTDSLETAEDVSEVATDDGEESIETEDVSTEASDTTDDVEVEGVAEEVVTVEDKALTETEDVPAEDIDSAEIDNVEATEGAVETTIDESEEVIPTDEDEDVSTGASGDLTVTSGVVSGDVTDSSAIVWSRASAPATMQVAYSANAELEDSSTIEGEATAKTDFTAKVLLEGLEADTTYYYQVTFTDGGNSSESVQGSFKTAPAADQESSISFVLLGDIAGQQFCRHVDGGYPIIAAMHELKPDFGVGNGDMIYADGDCPITPNIDWSPYDNLFTPEGDWENVEGDFPNVASEDVDWTDLESLREVYWAHYRYSLADKSYSNFLSEVPMYSQWDDHEVINDFGAPWDYWNKNNEEREGFTNLVTAGRDAFFHYSPIAPNEEEPNRIYRQFSRGSAMDLFIIDARSYRSRNHLEDTEENAKTLLGAEQLEWLKNGLANSKATWKVVSADVPLSIPTGSAASELGRDGWANGTNEDFSAETGFERELMDLMGFLDENNVENLIFVAMDVHFSQNIRYEFDADEDGDNLIIHEFITGPNSAIMVTPPELDPTLNPESTFELAGKFNFGYYRIEPNEDGEMVFTADVRSSDGEVFEGSLVEVNPN